MTGAERPVVTVFARSPDQGRGLARDMPVRWALEEVGQAYDIETVEFAELKEAGYTALNPFGQIPSYREGGLVLFESGAIVHHVAARGLLLPADPDARARALMWMFAALNTVEPVVFARSMAMVREREEPWFEARMPMLEDDIGKRLAALSRRLGDAEWLDEQFTCGDLLMINVLRRIAGQPLLAEHANLVAYVARGEARPAFRRAFAAQKALFEAGNAAG